MLVSSALIVLREKLFGLPGVPVIDNSFQAASTIYVYMRRCQDLKWQNAKSNNELKFNLTVHEEQRNKLEQMASLENRSVSNLIEIMANERWERLADQQGIAYAKTVAEAMGLKLDADNPEDRENCAEQFSIVTEELPKAKAVDASRILYRQEPLPSSFCKASGISLTRDLCRPHNLCNRD